MSLSVKSAGVIVTATDGRPFAQISSTYVAVYNDVCRQNRIGFHIAAVYILGEPIKFGRTTDLIDTILLLGLYELDIGTALTDAVNDAVLYRLTGKTAIQTAFGMCAVTVVLACEAVCLSFLAVGTFRAAIYMCAISLIFTDHRVDILIV